MFLRAARVNVVHDEEASNRTIVNDNLLSRMCSHMHGQE